MAIYLLTVIFIIFEQDLTELLLLHLPLLFLEVYFAAAACYTLLLLCELRRCKLVMIDMPVETLDDSSLIFRSLERLMGSQSLLLVPVSRCRVRLVLRVSRAELLVLLSFLINLARNATQS